MFQGGRHVAYLDSSISLYHRGRNGNIKFDLSVLEQSITDRRRVTFYRERVLDVSSVFIKSVNYNVKYLIQV